MPGPATPVLFGGNIGLWINGVNYTAYLVAQSPQITNTAYSQTGVFRFRLQSPAT
jgi:hypothetical protein